ncbi:TalC [Synechococcus phage S-CBM2]|nr:TalC [Synechococcus phage S-CBM2]
MDSSDINEIREAADWQFIDGVTTNPTLMRKQGKDPLEVIKEISDLFPETASISAEVVGGHHEEMLNEATPYRDYCSNITIKVPMTMEGLKACRYLTRDGVSVNVTLIFSPAQAILASKAGATYVSPFVGRVEDQAFDGIDLIRSIDEIYNKCYADTLILGASIRNVKQVIDCFKYGADVVTMPFSVYNQMYNHILTDKGLELFDRDWAELQSILKNDYAKG